MKSKVAPCHSFGGPFPLRTALLSALGCADSRLQRQVSPCRVYVLGDLSCLQSAAAASLCYPKAYTPYFSFFPGNRFLWTCSPDLTSSINSLCLWGVAAPN